jgi:hypothetical protein
MTLQQKIEELRNQTPRSKDFLNNCLTDIKAQPSEAKMFQETFCARCKNIVCRHAKGLNDSFTNRVNTQVDRFFNPTTASPSQFQIADFRDMVREALRLEISDSKQDWEIPVTDGVDKNVKPSIANSIGDSAKTLAESRGKSIEPSPVIVSPPAAIKTPDKPAPPIPEKPIQSTKGIVIGEGPAPKQAMPTVKDPWEVPTEKIVKPGTKIKLGS